MCTRTVVYHMWLKHVYYVGVRVYMMLDYVYDATEVCVWCWCSSTCIMLGYVYDVGYLYDVWSMCMMWLGYVYDGLMLGYVYIVVTHTPTSYTYPNHIIYIPQSHHIHTPTIMHTHTQGQIWGGGGGGGVQGVLFDLNSLEISSYINVLKLMCNACIGIRRWENCIYNYSYITTL